MRLTIAQSATHKVLRMRERRHGASERTIGTNQNTVRLARRVRAGARVTHDRVAVHINLVRRRRILVGAVLLLAIEQGRV